MDTGDVYNLLRNRKNSPTRSLDASSLAPELDLENWRFKGEEVKTSLGVVEDAMLL